MSQESKSESRKSTPDSDSAHPLYADIGFRILVTNWLLGCATDTEGYDGVHSFPV